MFARDYQDVEPQVEHSLPGVTARWPIKEEDGAPHFAMRVFDVEKGCATPLHSHWWEHEVFILNGEGYVVGGDQKTELHPGMVVFIPGDEMHQFVNTGEEVFRFICLIPHRWLEGLHEEYSSGSASVRGVC